MSSVPNFQILGKKTHEMNMYFQNQLDCISNEKQPIYTEAIFLDMFSCRSLKEWLAGGTG